MTRDVNLEITGNPEGLDAALAQAKAAVRSAVGEMEKSFQTLQTAMGAAQRVMVAFTAILGGGAAFKAAVDSTVNLSKESIALGRTLGIGATQASVLQVALGDVYATADQVTSATSKIAQVLNTDEQAFSRLGIATRQANGDFRNSFDILLDVNTRLSNLKEGTDRNVAGVQLFGRAWASIAPLLKLNEAALEAARVKAHDLGLEIGQEDVEATKRYRAALNDAGDVMQALQKTIGDALLPTLSETAEWFADIGPHAIRSLKVAIAEVQTVFIGLQWSFKALAETLAAGAAQLVETFVTLGEVLSRSLTGDFSGAAKAWDDGLARISAIGDAWQERLVEVQQDAATGVSDAWDKALRPRKVSPIEETQGTLTTKTTDEQAKARVSRWQTELEEKKAAWSEEQRLQGSFREYQKSEELNYWQGILDTQRTNQQEQLAIRGKIAQLKLAIDKEAFGAEIESLKAEEAAYRENGAARLEIAQRVAERMKQAYGEDSKEYAAARKDVIATERVVQEQLLQIRQQRIAMAQEQAMAEVAADEISARERAALNLITQEQLIAQEREFEERRYAIRREALEQSLTDPMRDPVEYARQQAEIEALEREHQTRLMELRSRALIESQKEWLGALRQMEGGFKSAISAMMKGTKNFADGMRDMTAAVVGAIIDMIAQIAAEWVVLHLAQLVGMRAAATGTILAKAAEAGAAGTASWAGAPWPINAGAPAFGASMYAAAASFATGVPVAEQGYDVPAGLNPVTQLHQREMVLPAPLADAVREMAAGGGAQRPSPPVVIKAMDARDVQAWANRPANRRVLHDAVRAHLGSLFGPRW